MTLKEMMNELNLSEAALKANFVRTQKTLAKRGILLTRTGRGEKACFNIEYTKDYNEYWNIPEYPSYPKIGLNNAEDLRGKVFGKLHPLYRTTWNKEDGTRNAYWVCRCNCEK